MAAREERKKNPVQPNVIAANPITTRLNEIQKLIDQKQYGRAETELKALIVGKSGEPRVYYTLGNVQGQMAVASTDPVQQRAKFLDAKKAYETVLKMAQTDKVDPALLSLSYVALGKIYEDNDESAYALKIYDAAISIGNVQGGAYGEAMAAKQRLLKDQ